MSVLKELYIGNINPSERYVKAGGRYEKLSNQLIEFMEEFMPLLNEPEKQLCNKIEDTAADLHYILEEECFIQGFRLGAQLMLETMQVESTNYI